MKIIKFSTPHDETRLGKPVAIKKLLPEWYRKAEHKYFDKKSNREENGLKTCMPFLDAMLSGYAIVTPFDIFVARDENGTPKITWNGPHSSSMFVSERPSELGHTMPTPAGHHSNHLIWMGEWGFKLPRGWSMLVTHPLNRYDLPFTTWSGIIESDKFWANGNLPFNLREDFVGTIPAGTPIAQLIPIKRAAWQGVIDQSYAEAYIIQGNTVRKKESNYKRKKWVRKEYN